MNGIAAIPGRSSTIDTSGQAVVKSRNECEWLVTDVMKMPAPRDPELLAKAARLYYVDDRSQDDVAAILGTTRSNVSRMLRQARDLGIVEIRIVAPAQRDHELERALLSRYRLADARVLEVSPETEVLGGVGRLAARWLDETLRDGQVVALSWGHSLQAMVRAVDMVRRDVEVVQLVGSAEARTLLLREQAIADALGAAKRADMAIVGIGAPGIGSSGALLDALALSPGERAGFDAAGAVGDVCGRFYDLSGQEVRSVVNQRVLAVTLDDLRAIPMVAGIAAGPEKALGILGALRGGIIDVLICDQQAASSVLRLDGGP